MCVSFCVASATEVNSFFADDWAIVYGSPTKLGLGLLSIAFDCGFFIQHHLYSRKADFTESPVEEANNSMEARLLDESINAEVNA
ncbi:cystinosin [Echinococcus multilocularis]|uniref:Cystinosin n=1 Tax=Echinococcus multilocularis TaxID=6211 RepID=A0A087W035_ECHMU|nr:cystinosin [Echinococcus multilocularis]